MHHLAKACRYGGALPFGQHYSVAEHSVHGARLAIEYYDDVALARAFLFHDAHEAYLTDVPTPVKELIDGASQYEHAMDAFDLIIEDKFKVSFDDDRIKRIDNHMLGVEWRRLMPTPDLYAELIDDSFPTVHLKCWDEESAYRQFKYLSGVLGILWQ